MKYYIAYLLTGSAEKAHNALTKEIRKKLGFVRTGPPHVTLKRPFESESIEVVEGVLEKFAKTHKKTQMRFRGYGVFEKKVIYADVITTGEVSQIIADLDEALQSLPGLEPDDYEKNRKLHSTIVDKIKIEQNFTQLWDFVTLGSFDFNVWLENIAILRKEKGIWKVYKEYVLK